MSAAMTMETVGNFNYCQKICFRTKEVGMEMDISSSDRLKEMYKSAGEIVIKLD